MGRSEKNHQALYYRLLRDAERTILRDFVVANDGSVSEAARMLQVAPGMISRRLRMLGGVLDGDPRREPYDGLVPKSNHDDAKHQGDEAEGEEIDADEDQPADDGNGAADSPDDS
jgi:hypothetical protein